MWALYEYVTLGRAALMVFTVGVLYFFYFFGTVIYNLYFHPLAKYPGPILAAATDWWWAYHWSNGKFPMAVAALHQKYGDVVRIAPNELNYSNVESYKEIYGHARKDRPQFIKQGFVQVQRGGPKGVSTESDPQKHGQIRKSLSNAFSAKALRTQTDLVHHYMGMFIDQLYKYGTKPEGVPANKWYTWLTFDIIGDLAFGEPFGAVEAAKSSAWVESIYATTQVGCGIEVCLRIPFLRILVPFLVYRHRKVLEGRKNFEAMSREKVKRRLAQDNSRDDFFSHVLLQKEQHLSEAYLQHEAQVLIIAGSETSTTFLSGVTYHLLKNPKALARLQEEVRGAFKNPAEINGDSAAALPYLTGVIEEGLRTFSPVSFGPTRVCPGAEINGRYVPPGVQVAVDPWSVTHDPRYFCKPNEFHPERWLPKDHTFHDATFDGDNLSAAKPFNIGPRACLGVNLAYLEMRMILATLVWHFDWELLNKDLDLIGESKLLLLWRIPDIKVRFLPVHRDVSKGVV